MVPAKLKALIDKYCMGVTPTDGQLDEIMDMAFMLNADSAEVSAYIKKKISGPTKEEWEKDAEKRAKKAKEAAARRAEKAAEEKKKKEAEAKAIEELVRKVSGVDKLVPVDLGLSVKWATFNVGASTPWDHGDYFAWGETEPKDEYDWDSYEFSDECDNHASKSFARMSGNSDPAQEMSYYCTQSSQGDVDNQTRLEPEDDAATANLGSTWRFWEKNKWRMPTIDELDELKSKCEWIWADVKGHKGYVIVGKNKNAIFLPAAGYKDGTELCRFNEGARYWSSSLNTNLNYKALALNECIDSFCTIFWDNYRYLGFSVRAVQD